MIVQRFNLNLIPNQSPVIVHVNQYDTGTGRLVATLYEGNEPYSPSGTAVIQGTKPDGHGFQYTATLDGNVVTADLTEQMSPVAGDVRVQIVVTESSGVTGTFVFIMRVQPSALPSDTEMSESDYQYIEEAIREAQEAVQTAQEATETAQEAVERAQEAITETQENAENSEAWAQGTRGGIPVGPTDPTYEHNAEYWAQYAERYAQGGLHYKASIPFADIPTTGMREGDMYDITDDFTTDSRFTEGAGIKVKGGTNIAWNSDNKWDILALPYIPKTTFNGRSGSILPMAGDYDSKKILLSSILHIGGETQSNVQEALEALSDDGVKSFNGRSGSILPMAGDYDSEKILLASVLHIGGETQENAQEALEALEGNKADKVDNAIADNFAGLDADGNLKDSGKKSSDFATPSDIAGQQSLVKDTVGWTGKNKLKITFDDVKEATGATGTWSGRTCTIGSLTITINEDMTVTLNGSHTSDVTFVLHNRTTANNNIKAGTYKFLAEGSTNKYFTRFFTTRNNSAVVLGDINSNTSEITADVQASDIMGVLINYTANTSISNVTIKPMIVEPSITDETYEPYHKSVEEVVEQIYADNGVLGAKNLLKNEMVTHTSSGITFTVNADKSITINAPNTQTGTPGEKVWEGVLPSGRYIFSVGETSQGTDIHYAVSAINGTTWLRNIVDLQGTDNQEFVLDYKDYDKIRMLIWIRTSVAINNKTCYPMIRLASDPDDTYQPYAMTNRELTEVKNVTATAGANVTVNANTNISKVGKIVSGSLRLEFTSALTVQQVLATLSDTPVKDTYAIGIESQTNKTMPIIILSNGRVLLFGSNLPTDTNNHLIIPVNFITA